MDILMKHNKIKMNNLTRGGQVTMNNFHMWVQVTKILSSVFLGCALTVFAIYLWASLSTDNIHSVYIYFLAKILSQFGSPDRLMSVNWHGTVYQKRIIDVLNNAYFIRAVNMVFHQLMIGGIFGSICAIPVTFAVNKYFLNRGRELSEDKFVRGMRLESPLQLEKSLKKLNQASDLTFDHRRIFKKDFEVQHMLLDGTTGSGKSVALRKLLLWIRARGDKAIVYDKGCSYVGKFYRAETDFLMNPFDERCVNWDVWCDAVADTDFENMASALIPMHGESEPFWVNAARSIFSSTAMKMSADENRSITKLLEVMLISKLENLSKYLEETESASLVDEKIQKTAISIKSVLATYIKSLRFLQGLACDSDGVEKNKFSIREWVKNDSQNGWLFISSNAEQHASLRPLISMWLSIASTSILGLSENYERRIWVIVDEAPSLHKLPELPETIAEVRKFGGCYVLGIQSVAQLRKVYGTNAANELFDLLNTRLFFRSPSNEMAVITSKELGEEEIEICKDNRSVGPNAIRDGMTFGFQTVTRPIVTPSEIMQLPDLSFYLRTPGEHPVAKVNLIFDKLKSITDGFIKRKIAKTPEIAYIEAVIAHYQIGNLNQLDKNEREQLIRMQEETYGNKEKEQQEMKDAVQFVNAKKSALLPDVSTNKTVDPTGVIESDLVMMDLD